MKQRYLQDAYRPRSTEELRSYYDRWSEVYDEELTENRYQQPRRCAQTLARLLPEREARILDVGCGTGLSGLALYERGYHRIDGCDLSTGMLEKAFQTDIYTKLFIADLNTPPLDAPDRFYDAVTAVGVLSHNQVAPEVLDELLRVLRPGGYIVIGALSPNYEQGGLPRRIAELERREAVRQVVSELGDYAPGSFLKGWVIALQRSDG